MSYGNSAAYELAYEDYEERARSWREASLAAVEGGRLDAEARRGVSAGFVPMVAIVLALAMSLFAIGGVSVSLTSGTVALLQANSSISSKIKDVRAKNDDLRIECSLLTRAERISRIATQNLGMVYASEAEVLDLG